MSNVQQFFSTIDQMHPDEVAAYFSENASYRFGNTEPTVGRAAIRASIAYFYQLLKGLRHQVVEVWEQSDATIVEGSIEYTLADNRVFNLPFASIIRSSSSNGLYQDIRIFSDVSPLFTPVQP